MASAKPNVIFVLGGPGSGKGTQCDNITKNFNFQHFSAGDLLRAERDSGSETAELINSYIVEGKIVPVEITCGLLRKAMEKAGWDEKEYLIDGFPRNENNYEGWVNAMGEITVTRAILFLDLDKETMKQRILKRGETSGRNDDNETAVEKRFNTYVNETLPVIEMYEKKGLVKKVDALGTPEEVFDRVKKTLEL